MPTRNVVLTASQSEMVEALVKSGRYQNASEVLRDGLRLLAQREAENAQRLDGLRQDTRLGAAGQRMQTRAQAQPSTSPVTPADTPAVDAIVVAHERLGGDAELARLAGLLSERLSNQTDIRALYRLGAEATVLIAWARIAQQSIEEATHLAKVLGAQ